MSYFKPLFAPNDYRKVVNFNELKELTGIKTTTLRTWLRQKRIPAFRSGRGTRWQFRREALEQWWKEMHREPQKWQEDGSKPKG